MPLSLESCIPSVVEGECSCARAEMLLGLNSVVAAPEQGGEPAWCAAGQVEQGALAP